MNYVEKRLEALHLDPDKFSIDDLHRIKNCLCFIRDSSDRPEEMLKAEKFLLAFVRGRENGVEFDVEVLRYNCGFTN